MIEPKSKDIEALCAAKGMRMTEQRRVIARVLAAADDHPDVEELYRRCSAIDDRISISTVYRTVKLFEDAGIIERHDFRDGRARYEQMPEAHHDHLINLRTGEVIEFQSEEIERLQAEVARKLGYRLVDHRLELYAVPLDDKPRAADSRPPRHFNCPGKPLNPRRPMTAAGRHGQLSTSLISLEKASSRDASGPGKVDQTGMSGARKVHIKSFGCQMNVYDSHRMADTLAPEGFAETATPDDADLVILNTCHIREKAAEKIYSELGRIRVMKQAAARDGRQLVIAVAGCVAQAEGEEIIRRAPAVDLVVGPQSYHRLPDLLARVARGEAVVDTEFPVEDKFDILKAPSREATRARGVSAFVTVQEGCDKFCTFCVVPYTRGAEVSRPVGQDRRRGRAARRRRRARGLADRTERQRLSRRGTGRPRLDARPPAASDRRGAGHRAAALHHQPSLRHGGEPDRRASRSAGADAVSASAGAVGLGPHPRRHEPPPHPRRLSRRDRAHARRAAGDRVLVRFHRRLPRRDRRRFPRDAVAGRRGRLRERVLVQIFAAAGNAGGRHGRRRCPRRSRPSGSTGCRPRIDRHQKAFNAGCVGRSFDVLFEKAGTLSWPDRRPLPISAAGSGHGAVIA